MSDLDRVRYDRHRRLLKDGLGEGVLHLCACSLKSNTDLPYFTNEAKKKQPDQSKTVKFADQN